MSIAVQSNSAASAAAVANLAVAFNSNNTLGNSIIVVGVRGNGAAGLNVSDTNNNSYTLLHGLDDFGNSTDFDIWLATNIAAGPNTVTLTPVGSSVALSMVILEYSQKFSQSPVDQWVKGTGSSTSLDSGVTSSLAQPTELAIAYGSAARNDQVFTAGSGWTLEQQVQGSGINATLIVEDKLTTSTAAVDGTASDTTTSMWGLAVITLKFGAYDPSQPFLGSIQEVASDPDDKGVFVGTFKVISSAPTGLPNPYLGKIKVVAGPPNGQSNPKLGQVVVVGSNPTPNPDVFLGEAQTS